ncbi:PREDICTED: cyclic phosphodiesterase-like [Camelina sativa]|uniref:Cyclic phosphodiesterase-like n=1 Tax=Camelina sativa TaxID=90675 RepID=A0ABM0V1K0_CAMSA|nr:PREDICTED: cyclic phosphodiesterase-like [Camelina sativa]
MFIYLNHGSYFLYTYSNIETSLGGGKGTMTEESATPLQPPQTQEAEEEEEKAMYSVWAVPEGEVDDRFRRVMEGLRSEFGGPLFDPHLTLVGPLPYKLTASEAKRMFKAACEGFKAYPATVDQVSAGTSHFQCIYLSLRHTVEVMNAAGHFMAHFKPMTGKFYVPHMSILYGDLTDGEKKNALEKAYALDPSLDGLNFRINRVALWITDADVGSWVKIDEHNLIS